MAETIEKSLLDLDFASLTRRTFTPSPAAWEDQVLYFLLLDRFSDGKEQGGYRDDDGRPASHGVTPLYRPEDPGRVDYDTWFRAGGGWQGGTLQGLRSKLGYLRRLGITDLPAVRDWLERSSGRTLNMGEAVELARDVLSRARDEVRDAERYVIGVCRKSPHRVAEYAAGRDLGVA